MENNNENVVSLQKIPVRMLLDILTDIWERGADFVDIIGVPDAVQDNILIKVNTEYFNAINEEEYKIEIEEEEEEKNENDDITFNDLIDG